MKKIVLLAAMCVVSTTLLSQTYKLETVFADKTSETYLSHWKVLETPQQEAEKFSLWGYQRFSDSWAINAYEVEYFKGDAQATFNFLKGIIEFTEKYKNEGGVLTYLDGVQVKTLKEMGFKFTLVYDRERKVVCSFNQKQWTEILDKFVSYCKEHEINYK